MLNSGFTVLELIAVIAIISILTLIGISGFRENTREVDKDRAVNGILLSLREVQVLATTAREFPTGSGEFDNGFGLFIEKDATEYILFGDTNTNDEYDQSFNCSFDDSGECIEERIIEASFSIDEICVGSNCGYDKLHVLFRRPSLGPVITADGNSGLNEVVVKITNSQGSGKELLISSTGKMYVVE